MPSAPEPSAPGAYPRLLSPGRLGPLAIPHRILHAPMSRGMSNRDGSVTAAHIDFLEARARGGAGLVSTEAAYVDPLGNSHAPGLGLHSEAMVPGLARAAEAVHRHGALLAIELFHAGRVGRPWVTGRQAAGPSAVAVDVLDPTTFPRAMSPREIADVVDAFAAAAERACRAGADAIWIHGGHGYLLSAFLSPRTNRRDDAYGGPLERRARLALDVVAAVREQTGSGVPILFRLNSDDFVAGGSTLADAVRVAPMLVAAGVDLIDVTGGVYESREHNMQDAAAPPGGFVAAALEIKRAVGDRAAVSAAQKLDDPEVAERALASGLDFVSVARALHADPEFVGKLAAGRQAEIVPCIYCLRCLDLHGTPGSAVECATNPATGFERRRAPRRAQRQLRVVVVGGGVAGMDAAVRLAGQGHAVSLHEASSTLGGQLLWAARAQPDVARLVRYLAAELTRLGVDVECGHAVDAAWLRDRAASPGTCPDLVVVATGAVPGPSWWPSDGALQVLTLGDVFAGSAGDWPGRVVVAGGDVRGCAAALHLAACDVRVTLVEPRALLAHDTPPATRDRWRRRVADARIDVRLEATVESLSADGVVIQHRGTYDVLAQPVAFVAAEMVAVNALAEELARETLPCPVAALGDCTFPRDVYAATQASAELADRVLLACADASTPLWLG